MNRRGYTEFKIRGGTTELVPNCEITGCPNCVCLGVSKSLCYPHGIEFGAFTKEQFEAARRCGFPARDDE